MARVRGGVNLSEIRCRQHIPGSYLGPREELEAWVRPQVEAWSHRVRNLGKIANQYPQLSYSGLWMSLQLEWKYLPRTVPGVVTIMGHIG